MSRLAVALLLICLHAGSVYGIDCSYATSKSFFEDVLTTCPRLTDARDKTYCCIDITNERAYCCNAEEFALQAGSILIPAIIGVVVVIGLMVCCISCLCCSCCPWYRRRQGTVYGNLQAPVVQVIQPQANIPPSYISQPAQNYAPPYPTGSTGMAQPPPYTNEAYAKQAPYNPNYLPSQ
ncbi:protein shisa-5 [Monomorium pharaonis]|uniref:protein shisa-5 n=1 Tax=Monomorium pharaonis TaxID=307658 RepID=UPI00063FC6A4|nr:protein shisa-5 [Monomorium pharaonis]